MKKISKYFSDVELVGPDVIKSGQDVTKLIDPKLLVVIDAIREKYGETIINNWNSGGQYKESGLRDPNTKTGAAKSMHKVGKAADLKFKKATIKEVYNDILKHQEYWMSLGLMRVENIQFTPTWLHVDTKPTGLKYIQVVNP